MLALRHPARLIFTSANDPKSLAIRLASNLAPVSHVGVGLIARDDQPWLLHAIAPSVVLEPFAVYKQRTGAITVAEYDVMFDISNGIEWGLTQVGRPYDKKEVAKRTLAFVLCPLAVRSSSLGSKGNDAWTCTRFVLEVGRVGGLTEWNNLNAALPDDLLQAVVYSPFFAAISDAA